MKRAKKKAKINKTFFRLNAHYEYVIDPLLWQITKHKATTVFT